MSALAGRSCEKGRLFPDASCEYLAGDDSPIYKQGSGRKELAAAVTDSTNPLTARVIVNRVWQWHFGQAIVGTPSNFGILGEKPSHPRLLDWLASTFTEGGGPSRSSTARFFSPLLGKWLSATRGKFAKDGDNRFFGQMNARQVGCGNLERQFARRIRGIGFHHRRRSDHQHSRLSAPDSLYSKISRSGDRFDSDAFLRLFGFPAPQSPAKRAVATIPPVHSS